MKKTTVEIFNTNETEISKIINKKSAMPKRIDEIAFIAHQAEEAWATHKPHWTLDYTTRAEFRADIDELFVLLGLRNQQKGIIRPLSYQLDELEDEIHAHVKYVKDYLELVSRRKNPVDLYTKFGIEKSKRHYGLPLNRQALIMALRQMVDGCNSMGFNTPTHEFGEAYWTDMRDRYTALSTQAREQRADVSMTVITKNTAYLNVRKVLLSIRNLIEANEPENAKALLRLFGFQKESY